MACYTLISSVANTINKLNIMSDLNSGYMHIFYHDKQDIIDELCCQYIKPLLNYIDHTELIQELKQNIDAADYDFFYNKEVKFPSKKKEIYRHDI